MHMHTDHFDNHQFCACEDDTDCSRPRGGGLLKNLIRRFTPFFLVEPPLPFSFFITIEQ